MLTVLTVAAPSILAGAALACAALLFVVQFAVFGQALYLYYPLVGALLARFSPPRRLLAPTAPPPRLALLIAAHDEEAVIGGALAAIAAQGYPARAYDVFVVADNCQDNTAAIARRTGATVYERFTDAASTKGQALQWLWAQIRHQGHGGVVVLDADNQPAAGFLAVMATELGRGHLAVQGLRKAKNVDGGTSGLDALTELCSHRVGAAGRMWLGLGGPLMGSGVAFQAALFGRLIENVGPTVAEDCEWQAKLALEGTAVVWTDRAAVYDEKTVRPEAMGTQRDRWMAGRGQVARTFTGPLLATFARTGSLLALDTALYMLAVPRSLLLAGMGSLTLLALAAPGLPGLWPAWIWLATCLGFVAYVLAGLWLDGAAARDYLRLFKGAAQLPRFTLQMAHATWKALTGAAVRWVPTPHGR
jgi:cellulose synthase/poly-beta-1,6-N-acetylglucosamine synthase-like glycosyltransferase